jgi:hypothetical protein
MASRPNSSTGSPRPRQLATRFSIERMPDAYGVPSIQPERLASQAMP